MSPMALIAVFSALSGTSEPTILRNRFSSLTKKNPMNITEKSPMPKAPRADATEPTTDVTELMSNALRIHPITASWIWQPRPRAGILSISQTFSRSNQTVISEALKEADWRLPETLVIILEKTGMIWVTIPRNTVRIRSRDTMAHSQSGALMPFIRMRFNPFIIGLPSRETTAAMIM